MEDIIIKELTNHELTEAEKINLEFWLNENPKHRKIYAQLKLAILHPELKKSETIKQNTWEDLVAQLKADEKQSVTGWINISRWIQVAAAVAILIVSVLVIKTYLVEGAGSVTNGRSEHKIVEKISQPGQKITSVLPDGSLVKMNADTRITIPEFFTQNKREVTLIGEAYFEVVKDPARPFIIHVDGFTVEVLGTSFNVKAYENNGYRGVAVKSGKVAVTNLKKNQVINLTRNQMILLDEEGVMEKLPILDADLFFGWIDQRMVFKDNSLDDVLHAISNWYGVDIEISEEINSDKPYTANYKNPVLEEVMQSLSHVYNFKYLIDGKSIIIN
ncbi:MAG: DUF4974 domain-containing protein [Cyclobacteriaceae bacterium]